MPAQAGTQASRTMLPCVYILASNRNGTLYTGVTSDPVKRVWQHKTKALGGFTAKYSVHVLVYFEIHATMLDAIQRERQVKKWRRRWKMELIERSNPSWRDLYAEISGFGTQR